MDVDLGLVAAAIDDKDRRILTLEMVEGGLRILNADLLAQVEALNSSLDEAMDRRCERLEAEINVRDVLIAALREEKEELKFNCRTLAALVDERNEEVADLYMQMSEE